MIKVIKKEGYDAFPDERAKYPLTTENLPNLDDILNKSLWVAKYNGYKDVGTYDEVKPIDHSNDPDYDIEEDENGLRDFDILAYSNQPEFLKPFFYAYDKYCSDNGFTYLQDYYDIISKELKGNITEDYDINTTVPDPSLKWCEPSDEEKAQQDLDELEMKARKLEICYNCKNFFEDLSVGFYWECEADIPEEDMIPDEEEFYDMLYELYFLKKEEGCPYFKSRYTKVNEDINNISNDLKSLFNRNKLQKHFNNIRTNTSFYTTSELKSQGATIQDINNAVKQGIICIGKYFYNDRYINAYYFKEDEKDAKDYRIDIKNTPKSVRDKDNKEWLDNFYSSEFKGESYIPKQDLINIINQKINHNKNNVAKLTTDNGEVDFFIQKTYEGDYTLYHNSDLVVGDVSLGYIVNILKDENLNIITTENSN